MVKRQLYVARLIGWLNVRYYIIEMHGRIYVIDYANPKDIRQYFSGFFPKHNKQYLVYDITNSKELYNIRPIPWWQSTARQSFDMLMFFTCVSLAMLTVTLKINWFYNESIFQIRDKILLMYVIGIVGIVFGLNKSVKTPNQLLSEKQYMIDRIALPRNVGKKRKVQVGSVGDFILTLMGGVIPLVFIFNQSYFIVFLGFMVGYSILFIRFLNFYVFLNENKFILLKEKEE